MSLNPDIARKLFEGMRFNLKEVVLPQLKEYPYPSSQAVSIYVLLKTLAGYASPEYEKSIQDSIEEMRDILREAKRSFSDRFSEDAAKIRELRRGIEDKLKEGNMSTDPFAHYQELMGTLDMLMKAVWQDAAMDETTRKMLKQRINQYLRRQLDKELALLI